MKIEKVNDNQIRCTLTREDLAKREIKISELAYGTEKAKNLFRDMMQQANFEFGFEAEDIPLMIEAIPLNSDCIVLIITKVEDPEELDTRFSRFAPSDDMDEEDFGEENPAREVMDMFRRVQDAKKDIDIKESRMSGEPPLRLFRFESLKQVIAAAAQIADCYQGTNSLYKEEATQSYLLSLTPTGCSLEDYDRICNILSEYGSIQHRSFMGTSFLAEHCQAILKDNALQSLGKIR